MEILTEKIAISAMEISISAIFCVTSHIFEKNGTYRYYADHFSLNFRSYPCIGLTMVDTIGPLAPNIKGRQNSDKCHFLKKYVKIGHLHRKWHLSIFQKWHYSIFYIQ